MTYSRGGKGAEASDGADEHVCVCVCTRVCVSVRVCAGDAAGLHRHMEAAGCPEPHGAGAQPGG